MKALILLAAVSLILGMAWKAQAAAPIAKPHEPPSPLVEGNNQFAIDLYHRLAAGSSGNVFVSPESISLALAMTYAGARGQTAEQMAKTLHFTQSPDQLNASFAAILQQWNAGGEKRPYQLSIANRLWAQQGYTFLEPFLKVTRDDFGAELGTVDFVHQSESARQSINAWVEKQTHDKIKDLLASGTVNADTRLVLTNAIYFKGDWQVPFKKEATVEAEFHLAADKTAKTPMMHEQTSLKYNERPGLQILEMPYKGGDLSMVVLLPAKVDGLAELEKSLTAEKLHDWVAGLKRQTVEVTFPKYKLTRAVELAKVLSAMGMPLAFTAKRRLLGHERQTRSLDLGRDSQGIRQRQRKGNRSGCRDRGRHPSDGDSRALCGEAFRRRSSLHLHDPRRAFRQYFVFGAVYRARELRTGE